MKILCTLGHRFVMKPDPVVTLQISVFHHIAECYHYAEQSIQSRTDNDYVRPWRIAHQVHSKPNTAGTRVAAMQQVPLMYAWLRLTRHVSMSTCFCGYEGRYKAASAYNVCLTKTTRASVGTRVATRDLSVGWSMSLLLLSLSGIYQFTSLTGSALTC